MGDALGVVIGDERLDLDRVDVFATGIRDWRRDDIE